METEEENVIKPASNDPAKEAQSHPDGPGLDEMLTGEEEKKPKSTGNSKGTPGTSDIPVI